MRFLLSLATLASCEVAPPSLDEVEPGLICDETESTTLTLRGSALRLVVVDAMTDDPRLVLPGVRFEPSGGLAEGDPAATDRIVEIAADSDRITWLSEDTVQIAVDPALGLAPGTWDVVVSGADGTEARLDAGLAVAGPPVVASVTPATACHGAESLALRVEGSGLLVLDDGGMPSVELGNEWATVETADDCVPLAGPVGGNVCGSLDVVVSTATQALGAVGLQVTNPEPAACASSEPAALEITEPPEVLSVEPDTVCADGGRITVEGEHFTADTTVAIGGETLDPTLVTYVDATRLEVEISGLAGTGLVDLTVSAPGECEATLPDALDLAAPPLVFWVDPAVVWSGAATSVTGYLSDVIGEITDA